MEKQAKYQDRILKFLPKAALNLPFSPNKEKRFSGPIIIPHEARVRRRRNSPRRTSRDDGDGDDDVSKEPTSPKISCMGQIKHKSKSKPLNKNGSFFNTDKPATWSPRDVTKQASKIKRMFSNVIVNKQFGRKSSASASSPRSDDHHHDLDHDCDNQVSLPDRAPSLSQMKRFASGRDRLSGFDWAAVQINPVDAEHRNIADNDDNDDVRIPFSAPLLTSKNGSNNNNDDSDNQVPLQPRKEINLWKRRTMAPPRPLVLNTMMIRAN